MNLEGNTRTSSQLHQELSRAVAASYCGFLEDTFVKWVKQGLLPEPGVQGWSRESLDRALKMLVEVGYELPDKRKPKPQDYQFPNVHRVKRPLTDGRHAWHHYFRPKLGDSRRFKLPGSPGSPEFMLQLIECERRLRPQSCPNELASVIERLPSVQPLLRSRKTEAEPVPPALGQSVPKDIKRGIIFLKPEEVSQRWRNMISVATLANWRSSRQGPPYVKLGKLILYPIHLLEKWELEHVIK